MTAQELLPIFEKAVEDWSKPIIKCAGNNTNNGLCFYFIKKYPNILCIYTFKPYWTIHRTTPYFYTYDFEEYGCTEIGRKQRLEALRLVVQDLKEEIKQKNKYNHEN